MCKGYFIPSVCVALGLAVGGFFPGYYFYKTKMDFRTVTVKGLAEKDVKADLAIWNIRFQTAGNDIMAEKNKIEGHKKIVIDFLKKAGFTDNEIMIQGLTTQDAYADSYRDKSTISARYTLGENIIVRTTQVDLIQNTAPNIGNLVSKGVTFNSYGNSVSYIFTALNDIKPQMLKEATLNAKAAADEFAQNSQSRVGKIRNASQGVFSITAREAVPDQMERDQINKKVRVVSTVEYYLE